MILKDHLLYIDITQQCNIGCEFCMYADKHKSGIKMELSDNAKNNLKNLINSEDVKRISVSGEGEPLTNLEVFYEILQLSQGENNFEFITSAFLPTKKLEEIYDKINEIVSSKGDLCNIRISADHYHLEKILNKPHAFSINYYIKKNPKNITFSFRSIYSDRLFLQTYLHSELASYSIDAGIVQKSSLEDVLVINEYEFMIDYKNVVNPKIDISDNELDLQGYIAEIEKKYGKDFTFGSLNKFSAINGMDVTIKPNGDVFFYGVEPELIGNMHINSITWEYLANQIEERPLLRLLYTKPLKNIIKQLGTNPRAANIIKQVNNPYWVVKELANKNFNLAELIW